VSPPLEIWIIAALAAAGVLLRPFALPEAIWAGAGAALLVGLRLVSPQEALTGAAKGADVYLFLVGMMLLAEVARAEGLFDWLAAAATRRAGDRRAGVAVFLSNDATAVVLTPAVAAAVRTAKAAEPLPYLLICAFVANAASFVLPISNPANLVIYGAHMPPLLEWLPRYLPASVLAIAATFFVLRWTQRDALRAPLAAEAQAAALSASGRIAALGLAATAVLLLTASARGDPLGLPTAIAGAVTAAIVLISARKGPWTLVKQISWGVLPLVAGLLILVEALVRTGLIGMLSALLRDAAQRSAASTAWGAGLILAFASNLINNLPAGLVAASGSGRAGSRSGDERGPDWRRPWAEPVRDRLARHHFVTRRASARRTEDRRRRVPEAWSPHHAAGAAAGAWGGLARRSAGRAVLVAADIPAVDQPERGSALRLRPGSEGIAGLIKASARKNSQARLFP
jgi:arsenical pump membrane protein